MMNMEWSISFVRTGAFCGIKEIVFCKQVAYISVLVYFMCSFCKSAGQKNYLFGLISFGLVMFYCISTFVDYSVPIYKLTHTHTHARANVHTRIYIYIYIWYVKEPKTTHPQQSSNSLRYSSLAQLCIFYLGICRCSFFFQARHCVV